MNTPVTNKNSASDLDKKVSSRVWGVMVGAALLLLGILEYCEKADSDPHFSSKGEMPILADSPSKGSTKSLTEEEFSESSEERTLDNKEWVDSFYENLLDHQEKEIYLVHTKACPMDQVFYCFSEQELKETLASLIEENHKVEKTWAEDQDAIVEAYSIYDHVDKIRLDSQKIKEILEYQATHPLFFRTRELWRDKLAAFEKIK